LTLSVKSFQTPRHLGNLGLAAELALGADLAGDARHLRGEHAQLLDHRVDDVGGLQELAAQRPAVDIEFHGLQQVALGDGGDRAGHFTGRPQQVVDQRVDRAFHVGPGAAGESEPHALPGLAFAADDLSHALELLRHPLVRGHNFVKSVGDLAVDSEMIAGHANRKITAAHRLQGVEQLLRRIGLAVFQGAVFEGFDLRSLARRRRPRIEITHGSPRKRPIDFRDSDIEFGASNRSNQIKASGIPGPAAPGLVPRSQPKRVNAASGNFVPAPGE